MHSQYDCNVRFIGNAGLHGMRFLFLGLMSVSATNCIPRKCIKLAHKHIACQKEVMFLVALVCLSVCLWTTLLNMQL